MAVSDGWFDWPALPDLFPKSFPGVKTSRDAFLIDTDLDRLRERVADYFNPELSHEEIARRYPAVMKSTARFDARSVRDALLTRGGPVESGFVRYAYRPFDDRWLYWEADTKLLDEKRAEYRPHVFAGNRWMVFQTKARPDLSPPLVTSNLGDLNQMNSSVYCVPTYLREDGLEPSEDSLRRRPNLSSAARRYLDALGMGVDDLFHHILAVLHDPAYNRLNADALRAEGPRIPLPGWPDPTVVPDPSVIPAKAGIQSSGQTPPGQREGAFVDRAAQTLSQSAARGRELARLLDPETPVPGVTMGPLRPEIGRIAVPSTIDGGNMFGADFELTAGWGHFGSGQAVMPGQGRVVQRPYTSDECQSLNTSQGALGETTCDVHLNDRAYWRNVPAGVWDYKLGGYQVLKKWLSYRERAVLGRPLTPDEVAHFANSARRIGAILLLTAASS